MTKQQLEQYDRFLDENDWDIYYWATQEPAEKSGESSSAKRSEKTADKPTPRPRSTGEWAQTVGTFKPAYRPVPTRWQNSEILAMLRKHVVSRSAGGIQEGDPGISGDGLSQSVKGTGGGGKNTKSVKFHFLTAFNRYGLYATCLPDWPIIIMFSHVYYVQH